MRGKNRGPFVEGDSLNSKSPTPGVTMFSLLTGFVLPGRRARICKSRLCEHGSQFRNCEPESMPSGKRKSGRRAPARKTSRKKKAGRKLRRGTGESPAADALTTGWLLALLFLLACELGGLVTWLLGDRGLGWQLAAEYLLVASLALALFALGLLAVVLRVRRSRPPAVLVAATWALSLLPWGVYLLLWWRHAGA